MSCVLLSQLTEKRKPLSDFSLARRIAALKTAKNEGICLHFPDFPSV